MLTLYLIALGVGGGLVGLTLFGSDNDHGDGDLGDGDLGGAGDLDHGDLGDLGHHGVGHHDHGGDALVVSADAGLGVADFLPITSLRFWTFFLAAGGLTGTLLTVTAAGGVVVTGVLSAIMGYLSGTGVSYGIRRLQRGEVTSTLGERALIGAVGTVTLPVGKGMLGQVRVRLPENTMDVSAETEEDVVFNPGDDVLIYEIRENGVAIVTRKPS